MLHRVAEPSQAQTTATLDKKLLRECWQRSNKMYELSLPMADLLAAHGGPALVSRSILGISFSSALFLCVSFIAGYRCHQSFCRLAKTRGRLLESLATCWVKRVALESQSGHVVASERGVYTEGARRSHKPSACSLVRPRPPAFLYIFTWLPDSRPRPKTASRAAQMRSQLHLCHPRAPAIEDASTLSRS